ncbi:hypothetical protein [Novosphingobium soli]|uniref:Tetratricopeptide repeat protein n=1 Tax=Novosphingobium soli TaxID=574956 RepID=A0ABV6CPP1_9SPHN
MSIFALAAAVVLGTSALSQGEPAAGGDDVAYAELSAGQPQEAVRKLEAGGAPRSDDPAVLINLGAAYARAGQADKALAAYRAAVATPVRYDLELADGTWVDSRIAARQALRNMLAASAVAAR